MLHYGACAAGSIVAGPADRNGRSAVEYGYAKLPELLHHAASKRSSAVDHKSQPLVYEAAEKDMPQINMEAQEEAAHRYHAPEYLFLAAAFHLADNAVVHGLYDHGDSAEEIRIEGLDVLHEPFQRKTQAERSAVVKSRQHTGIEAVGVQSAADIDNNVVLTEHNALHLAVRARCGGQHRKSVLVGILHLVKELLHRHLFADNAAVLPVDVYCRHPAAELAGGLVRAEHSVNVEPPEAVRYGIPVQFPVYGNYNAVQHSSKVYHDILVPVL